MKDKPAATPRSTEQESAARPDDRDRQPPRPDRTMQTEPQIRRARGRLSREDQRRLGDVLQRVYDDVLKQGVPDRFKDLIDQLDRNEGVSEREEDIGIASRAGSQGSDTELGLQAKGNDKSKDQS